MAKHVARSERVTLGAYEWALILAAGVAAAATVLELAGLSRGERADSGWALILAPLLSAGCVVAAWLSATTPTVRTSAPEPVGAPAILTVSSELGAVFWLYSAAVAALVVLCGQAVERLLPVVRAPGLISAADALAAFVGLAIGTMFVALIPRRILLARRRILLWLSDEGIGYPPVVRGDGGFIGWERVQNVSYAAQWAYRVPVIVAHRWTINYDNSTKTRTIEYPPGAVPRPRRIRRTIDELLAD